MFAGRTMLINITDHLGNVRVVLNNGKNVVETNDYYPYGMLMDGGTKEVQPFKYCGKELDRMHGLNWYDHGARMSDPALGRWHVVDPLAEKYYDMSPYVMYGDNPIRKVDKKGEEPGDFFKTMDDAAIDFGMIYNSQSINNNSEYMSNIFSVKNKDGEFGYTYAFPIKGSNESCSGNPAPRGSNTVAIIHTHGASTRGASKEYYDNEFSGTRFKKISKINDPNYLKKVNTPRKDITLSNSTKKVGYLASPNGMLQKYDPKSGKISCVSTDLPSDPKCGEERLNSNNPERVSWLNSTFIDYLKKLNELEYKTNKSH